MKIKKISRKVRRINIGAAPIDPIAAKDAADWTLDRLNRGISTSIAAINAYLVVMANRNPPYKIALEELDLLIVDGFWTALAASLLCRYRIPHTNTSPFLRLLFRRAGDRGLRVFLLGARPEVVKKAAANMHLFHPKATVVGFMHGYFEPSDEASIVKYINLSGADVVLLGMSSPKKEYFMSRYKPKMSVPLCIGVGGQFDIWGGQAKEAPDIIRKYGFEWLIRLIQEPGRLWRRYTIDYFRFLLIVFRQLLKI